LPETGASFIFSISDFSAFETDLHTTFASLIYRSVLGPIQGTTQIARDRPQHVWEIHCETDLASDPGTRLILSQNQSEGKPHAGTQCRLPADHALQLPSTKLIVVRTATIDLAANYQQ
jgi:hypothetical protein